MATPARVVVASKDHHKVLVASKNPVKVEAVRRALAACFPRATFRVEGQEAPSGVPDQPFGDQETLLGAKNRVSHIVRHPGHESCGLFVAIEGGVGRQLGSEQPGVDECFAWVAAQSPTGAGSAARTASFPLPQRLSDLINRGMELGAADDLVFGRANSKHGQGTVGKLSKGLIDRTAYYEHAVILALVPWMNPEQYGQEYKTPFL